MAMTPLLYRTRDDQRVRALAPEHLTIEAGFWIDVFRKRGLTGDTMQTQDIEYQINGKKFVGYLADGSNGKKTAGVLVAHEGGGMTGHPKERARMLAELGYVAFAMDTFGEADRVREQAMAVIGSLSNDLATLRNRANTALDLLKSQTERRPDAHRRDRFLFRRHHGAGTRPQRRRRRLRGRLSLRSRRRSRRRTRRTSAAR